jgi:iron complex outermembrane recepter protein
MSAYFMALIAGRYRLQTFLSIATAAPIALTCAYPLLSLAQTAPLSPSIDLGRVEVPGKRPAPAPLSLDDVAKTASHLDLPVRQLPMSVSVIDRQEIERRGFRTPLEAAVTAVGVTGGILPGSVPRYSMRGFSDNNITLLRDGIRQNTLAQSSRPVDTFVLDRIEVLKGPASLMHGEGAVAGAVNYVSRAPEFSPSTELLGAAGSYDAWRIGATTTAPFAGNTAAYRLTGAVSDSGSGYVDRSASRISALALGLAFKPSTTLSASVQFDGQVEDIASWFGLPVIYDRAINTLNGQPRTNGPANTATDVLVNARIEPQTRRSNYNLQDSYTDGKNTFTRAMVDWRANASFSLRAQLYYATHFLDWRNAENYVWNPNTSLVQRDLLYIYRDDDLTGAKTQMQWMSKLVGLPLHASFGVDTHRNNLVRGTRAPGALPAAVFNVPLLAPDTGATPIQFTQYVPQADARITTYAPFIEAALDFAPDLKLIGGLRHDRIKVNRVDRLNAVASVNQRYAPTTGRIGAVWSAAPQAQVYASYATSADPVQQFVSITAQQAALSLQKGRQIEVGIKQSNPAYSIDWTLALYGIRKNNLLTTTLVNGVSTSQPVGQQSSRGVEAAIAWRPHPVWQITANAAWTRARFDDFAETVANPLAGQSGQPATVLINRSGKTPTNVPQRTAHLYAHFNPAPQWSVGAGLRYVSQRFANSANLIELADFLLLDAVIEYARGGWTATLRGRNLSDKLYADWAINQGLQQRVGDPRTFELAVRHQF